MAPQFRGSRPTPAPPEGGLDALDVESTSTAVLRVDVDGVLLVLTSFESSMASFSSFRETRCRPRRRPPTRSASRRIRTSSRRRRRSPSTPPRRRVWRRRRRPRSESPRWRWTSREADDRRADSRSGSRRESMASPSRDPSAATASAASRRREVGRWICETSTKRERPRRRGSIRRADDDIPGPPVPLTAALTAGVPPASVLLPGRRRRRRRRDSPRVWWIYRRVGGALAASVVAVEIRTRARLLPATRSRRGSRLGERHRAYEFQVSALGRTSVRPTSHEMLRDAPGDAAYSSCDLSLVASWRKSRADSSSERRRALNLNRAAFELAQEIHLIHGADHVSEEVSPQRARETRIASRRDCRWGSKRRRPRPRSRAGCRVGSRVGSRGGTNRRRGR